MIHPINLESYSLVLSGGGQPPSRTITIQTSSTFP